MELDTKTREEIVKEQATVTQASATVRIGKILNFAVGTVLLAIEEAVAGVVLWLQGLITKVLSATRLSSSVGDDVDSFIADFDMTRLDPVAATGNVVFSRSITTFEAKIPVGAIVQTALTSIQFKVVADTANPDFDIAKQQYIIPIGRISCVAKVEAVIKGINGNVATNTITVFFKPISYVDFVTNPNPFVNGEDKETDAHAKTRFVSYINSLSKATKLAISAAIEAVQDGIEYVVVENIDYDSGVEHLGYFFVVIDDGTGSPPPELIATVTNAVDRVRGLTTMFVVKPAIQKLVNVVVSVYINKDLYNETEVKSAVEVAIEAYIDSLMIGNTLHYTKIIDIAYDAHVAIQNVTGLTLNGGTADVTSDNKHSLKTGTMSVSVLSI